MVDLARLRAATFRLEVAFQFGESAVAGHGPTIRPWTSRPWLLGRPVAPMKLEHTSKNTPDAREVKRLTSIAAAG